MPIATLKKELDLLHEPWIKDFGDKLNEAVSTLTNYVDTQIGQLSSRIESVERVQKEWCWLNGIKLLTRQSQRSSQGRAGVAVQF